MGLLYYTVLYCNFLLILASISNINLQKGMKKMFSPPKGKESFMYFPENEYPRTDEGSRKLHRTMWENYYSCLNITFSQVNSAKVILSTALVALEGTSITLNCQICISPDEMYRNDLIQWYHKSKNNAASNIIVEPSNIIIISRQDWSLTLYNIKVEQSGEYSCRMGNTISGVYHLTVDRDTEKIRIVHSNRALNGPYQSEEKSLPLLNLKLYTLWSEWSACSPCDMVGKKFRYGYCAIALLNDEENMNINHNKFARELTTLDYYDETSTGVETTNQYSDPILNESNRNMDATAIDHLRIILRIFNNTVPCKSQLVPTIIRNISDIENRVTEKMIRFCKKPCAKNTMFEVHDKRGNILETANNSAGIYSMVQGVPALTTISHVTAYEKRGSSFTLVCPSIANKRSPLVWKKQNVILNAYNAKRIKFVAEEYLKFKKLETNDSGIYSCWQNNENVGVVKLIVTDEVQLEINEPVMLFGSTLIIIVFLIIFVKTFQANYEHAIH